MTQQKVRIEIVGLACTGSYAVLVNGKQDFDITPQSTPQKALEAARAVYPGGRARATRHAYFAYTVASADDLLQKALDKAAADLARLYAAARVGYRSNDPRVADIGHALYLIKRAAA